MLFSCKAQCLPSGPRLNVQQSESQRANCSSPSEQHTIRPSDAKIPEAGLTLSSLICMFELISTLTPLHKCRPRSPFIDVVLSTLTSPHSSPWLWGNVGHNGSYLISSFPGNMRTCLPHVTCRFVGKYKVGTASLFNDPQPQPPPTLHLTSPTSANQVQLESERSFWWNPDARSPCFHALIWMPIISAVICLHWLSGTPWFFKKRSILTFISCISCTSALYKNDWRAAFSPSVAFWRLLLASSILPSFITNKDSAGLEAFLSQIKPVRSAVWSCFQKRREAFFLRSDILK